MDRRWFSHLKSKENKLSFEKRLKNAKDIFIVLEEILEQELETIQRGKLKLDNYTKPNWAEYQADRIGSERAITKIINLLPKD